MEEKLRKKKLLLKLIGVAIVAIAVATVFIPIFKITKTEELFGVKEEITAEFSAWQIITQDKNIALNSTSALGEFNGVNTISIEEIFGEKNIALIVMIGLIVLAVPFVSYAKGLLFASLIGAARRATIKYFLLSFFLFTIFPLFPLSIVEENTGYLMSPPILILIIFAIAMIALLEIFDKIFKDIGEISAELFIRKYKNENKKWFETFVGDIADFMDNANIEVELDTFVRFADVADRKELREKEDDDV